VGLACLFLAPAVFQPLFLLVSASAVLGVAVINRKLYAFFFRRQGFFFAGACILLHLLYYLYSGLSYLYVLAEFQLKRATAVGASSAAKY
jgi:hypothetical protein